jgi:EAL domain-containing protein (putative c-di-GMP-specific phosphodiesterase class I)
MNGRRRAVVIGVNHASIDTTLQKLRFAEADAVAMRAQLIDSHVGTFDPDDVQLLIGVDATADRIMAELRAIALSASPADVLLVYFAGQGIVPDWADMTDAYLVTSDLDLSQLRLAPQHGLRMRQLRQDVFEQCRGSTFLILDCCHAGAYAEAGTGPAPLLAALGAYETQVNQHSALMACPPDGVTRELADIGHGVFTDLLLRGLRGAAAGPDGTVRFADLVAFARTADDRQRTGLFTRDWGPTTALTRPAPDTRTQADAVRAPEVKFIPLANPLEVHVATIRQILDRMFRLKRSLDLGHDIVERIAVALEAHAAAAVDIDADGVHVTASSRDFQTADLAGLYDGLIERSRHGRRALLGHTAMEEGGRRVLAVPLTHDSRDGLSMLLVVDGDRHLCGLGEPLAPILRAVLDADFTDERQAEIDVLTALRTVFGRVPLELYQHCFQLYKAVLETAVMVFEPVVSLNTVERGISVSSYEALARRDKNSASAPLRLLDSAPVWGDQFLIERDTILATKAIRSYAEAHDRAFGDARPLPCSINVAVRTLLSDSYAVAVGDAITSAGLAPDGITLEISERDEIEPPPGETWLPDKATYFRDRLSDLVRQIGVRFAIDDFGVAHASLDRLSTLTLAQIKVDRAILKHDVDLAKAELALVVQIAQHQLQRGDPQARPVVVEGVDEQIRITLKDLFDCGIHFVQGYITDLRASPELARVTPEIKRKLARHVRGEL